MIFGIGVDLVTISRIASVHQRRGERFARRFLADIELVEYAALADPDRFLAKRFAVKEAAVKALGTGEREGVLLKDFYLSHSTLGKPCLHATGRAADIMADQNIYAAHVSLSDELDQVIAMVVLEKLPQ